MELGKINGTTIQVENPPGQVIIVPSGFTGYFLVISEFAEDESILEVDRMTKEEIEERFNIELEVSNG